MHRYSLAIAHSHIRHRRYLPNSHEFSAQLKYLCFDPDKIVEFSQKSWLWSTKRWNLLTINKHDFLNMESGNIRQKVQRILLKNNDFIVKLDMEIRVVALPRTLGFRFNSVVFYVVFDDVKTPCFVLSEITNTPWNERKVYIHDCRENAVQKSSYQSHQFEFKKEFHVSPFMPMDLDYRWQFSFSEEQTIIHMQLFQTGVLQFDATMQFSLQPITLPSQQTHYAISSVLEPFKMVIGIYTNAFRLWKKKIPFYRHPKKDNGKIKL
ncbi:DUF1365 domain-containing protein [Acinetobacter faecalis]|uniref:DUF1365 family protein n=1 Tax=Acinetobacter faecalis TaxID=2665161 RepID=A0A6L6GEL5_9GAMM|nr:DUF1365 domain-containing protein [Acinetobacter faecalis]MDY6483789.1 DUF1365 domain-containing protein [Acinetobacter faecalis]MTD11163.1 DUF1365 family protein [Acinetobacter faecalis]